MVEIARAQQAETGLATMRLEGPNLSTNFRKKAVFSSTDEGRKILVREEY